MAHEPQSVEANHGASSGEWGDAHIPPKDSALLARTGSGEVKSSGMNEI